MILTSMAILYKRHDRQMLFREGSLDWSLPPGVGITTI